jgi:hypothetical protein
MKRIGLPALLLFSGCAARPALGQTAEYPYRCEVFAQDAAGRLSIRWQMADGVRLTPYAVTWWGSAQANGVAFNLTWEAEDPATAPPAAATATVALDRSHINGPRHRLSLWQGEPRPSDAPALLDGRMSDIGVFPRIDAPWRVFEGLIAGARPLSVTVDDQYGRTRGRSCFRSPSSRRRWRGSAQWRVKPGQ